MMVLLLFIQKFGHENAIKRNREPPRFSHNLKYPPSTGFANYCGFTIQGAGFVKFQGLWESTYFFYIHQYPIQKKNINDSFKLIPKLNNYLYKSKKMQQKF
jgi:hypothetical protein